MTHGQAVRICAYLAITTLRRRHAGSAGGMFWAVAGPALTILVIWFALDQGLGLRRMLGPEYGLRLIVGLATWQFFSDAIQNSALSITSNPHLVKKVVFPVVLLPISSTLASWFVHLVVMLVLLGVLAMSGHAPGPALLALPAWLLLSVALTAAASVIVAGLNVLVRDVSSMLPSVMTLGFWITPVVWPVASVPETWKPLVMANPMAVIIEGYRSALLGVPVELGPALLVGFSAGVVLLMIGAVMLFTRMAHEFSDAL